jgi:hypothetical protein
MSNSSNTYFSAFSRKKPVLSRPPWLNKIVLSAEVHTAIHSPGKLRSLISRSRGDRMRKIGPHDEPLCETSEKGERHFSKVELKGVSLEIGRRVLEIFGHGSISTMVFRLRSTSDEIRGVVNGGKMPSTELLLAISKATGASVDWLLTGSGNKYLRDQERSEGLIKVPRPRVRVPSLRRTTKRDQVRQPYGKV